MAGWLAKAEQLLEKADRKAGEKIEKVKERVGLQRATTDIDEQDDSFQISAAAMALLEKSKKSLQSAMDGTEAVHESRGNFPVKHLHVEGSNSALEADEGHTSAEPDAYQHRRARLAEWEALGQEIQILNEHGRKIQQRLAASATALDRSKAAEALARSQLQDALAASATLQKAKANAEQAADAVRDAMQVALASAETRRVHLEELVATLEQQVKQLQQELLVARKNEDVLTEWKQLHAESLAAVEQAAAMEQESAERREAALLARAVAAERREADLTARNQELAAALGGGARQVEASAQVACAAQITVAKLEADLARVCQQRDAALAAEKEMEICLSSAREELAISSKERDEARLAGIATERTMIELRERLEDCQAQLLEKSTRRVTDDRENIAANNESAEKLAERDTTILKLIRDHETLKRQLDEEVQRRVELETLQAANKDALRIDMPSVHNKKELTAGKLPTMRDLLRARDAQSRPLLQVAYVVDDITQLVDRASLQICHVLRKFAGIRLAVTAYLMLLHVWLFFLLMHMAPDARRHQHQQQSTLVGTGQ